MSRTLTFSIEGVPCLWLTAGPGMGESKRKPRGTRAQRNDCEGKEMVTTDYECSDSIVLHEARHLIVTVYFR